MSPSGGGEFNVTLLTQALGGGKRKSKVNTITAKKQRG
jgi:hypothetical protein